MHYIGWIEIIDNKKIIIKRKSNCKWYSLIDILIKIKEWYDQADLPKLRWQYFTEYKEIEKICFVFWIPISTHLKCKKEIKE